MANLPLGCAGSRKTTLNPQELLEMETKFEQDVVAKIRYAKKLDNSRGIGKGAAKIVKQRKVLKILTKENLEIQTDLFLANAPEKLHQDALVRRELRDMLKEYDNLDEQIKAKKSDIKDVEYIIDSVKRRIILLKKQVITDTMWDKYVQDGEKTLSTLENKLETQTKQFGKILVGNQKLREDIEHLLFQRREFNKQWERVVGGLKKGKTFLMDIVEQATIAYDQRDEICQKLDALRSKAYNDLILQTEEMISLQRKLDHDTKLRDFLRIKCQIRNMYDIEMNLRKKRRENIDKMQQDLFNYQELLAKSAEFVGSSEGIDAIIFKYMQLEETNFTRFNFICHLGKEIEDLTSVLYKVHAQIDMQYQLREHRKNQQIKRIEELSVQLEDATRQREAAEELSKVGEEKLIKVCAGVEYLFNLCSCSKAPILQLLGNNTQVHQFNVLLYLNLLEDRIKELLLLCYYKQTTEKAKNAKGKKVVVKKGQNVDVFKDLQKPKCIYTIEEIVQSNPCPLCVDQEMVSDVIDELQFVLTKEVTIKQLRDRMSLPGALERIHNVSACHLPKSRQIIQRRYQ